MAAINADIWREIYSHIGASLLPSMRIDKTTYSIVEDLMNFGTTEWSNVVTYIDKLAFTHAGIIMQRKIDDPLDTVTADNLVTNTLFIDVVSRIHEDISSMTKYRISRFMYMCVRSTITNIKDIEMLILNDMFDHESNIVLRAAIDAGYGYEIAISEVVLRLLVTGCMDSLSVGEIIKYRCAETDNILNTNIVNWILIHKNHVCLMLLADVFRFEVDPMTLYKINDNFHISAMNIIVYSMLRPYQHVSDSCSAKFETITLSTTFNDWHVEEYAVAVEIRKRYKTHPIRFMNLYHDSGTYMINITDAEICVF